MEKVNYDSYYKFKVSMGIVLIIAPIIAFFTAITRDFDIITQKKYSQLCGSSKRYIDLQNLFLKYGIWILFVLCLITVIIGLLITIKGAKDWYENEQKPHDEMIKLEIQEKRLNNRMTNISIKKLKLDMEKLNIQVSQVSAETRQQQVEKEIDTELVTSLSKPEPVISGYDSSSVSPVVKNKKSNRHRIAAKRIMQQRGEIIESIRNGAGEEFIVSDNIVIGERTFDLVLTPFEGSGLPIMLYDVKVCGSSMEIIRDLEQGRQLIEKANKETDQKYSLHFVMLTTRSEHANGEAGNLEQYLDAHNFQVNPGYYYDSEFNCEIIKISV